MNKCIVISVTPLVWIRAVRSMGDVHTDVNSAATSGLAVCRGDEERIANSVRVINSQIAREKILPLNKQNT